MATVHERPPGAKSAFDRRTTHVSVRLEPEVMARVDALGPIFFTPWRVATRSDILRGLILDGLPTMEAKVKAEQPQKKGARR